jgi:hypothetical protein
MPAMGGLRQVQIRCSAQLASTSNATALTTTVNKRPNLPRHSVELTDFFTLFEHIYMPSCSTNQKMLLP